MKNNQSILIVDDESTVLLSLKKLIQDEFSGIDIILARNGLEAWNLIQSNLPSIVISDINMPELDGKQLIQKIRARNDLNEVYIIVLSANSESDLITELLNKGADDFISKSANQSTIRARIGVALRINKMQQSIRNENELLTAVAAQLESDVQDLTMLAVKFMEARIPASIVTLTKVAEASVWIAKEFENYDADTIRSIEIASYLSIAGRMFLPDNLINEPVMINGIVTSPLMSQVPVSGKEIISSINRFKSVGQFIYHIYENFDGTGIPMKLQSWQIPFPSRIIRAVLDYYETRIRTSLKPEQIISNMKNQSKRLYDHRVIVLLDHYIRSVTKEINNPHEKVLKITELIPGQELTRDVITDAGLKLISTGAKLTEKSINMIINHNANDHILGGIFIKK